MANPEEILVIESPKVMLEGESLTFNIEWQGASSLSSEATYLYLNGSDYSSTALSGSNASAGNVQTLKTVTAQAGDGGKKYVLVAEAQIDGGNTERRKLIIDIVKAGAE